MLALHADSCACLDSDFPGPAAPASVRDTVLVVEDQDHVAGLLACMLERANFRVLRARDGAEGLRLFAEHGARIALAMLDGTLPDMSGDSLGRRLRQCASGLPVLFVSGRDVTALRTLFAGESLMDFVTKPFFPADVLRQARKLIAAATFRPADAKLG